MYKSEYISNQKNCSNTSMKEIQNYIINIMKYLKSDKTETDADFFIHTEIAEFSSILPKLERNLNDAFLKVIHLIVCKKQAAAFSLFLEDWENLLTLIFELVSQHKVAHVIIPCVCSIATKMYYIEETFSLSEEILLLSFARYSHLRLFILDGIYKTATSLNPQSFILKHVENIGKSILVFMQSIPVALPNNASNDFLLEKTHQQIQDLMIHWVQLFINDIDSKMTNESLPNIFSNFIRHITNMLSSFKFPIAPFLLIIILRTLLPCSSCEKNTLLLRKFALEQICFIIVHLKKIMNCSSLEENVLVIKNMHKNLKTKLKKPEERIEDVKMCGKVLLIRHMENQCSAADSFSSPIQFFRLNFLRYFMDGNQNGEKSNQSAKKRKLNESDYDADRMKYYYHQLKTISYDLKQAEADVIYQYLVFSSSEIRLIVDRYFERIILTTSVKNNSIRLNAVKQLIPLIEVNNSLLSSTIFKIAIRSLILDHCSYVRENILVAFSKIILLYEPHSYAEIFDTNCENILTRLLDVNGGVRKAALNVLKNFCLKNRSDKIVLKIICYLLNCVRDKDDVVKRQIMEIFQLLWFSNSKSKLEHSVTEIIHLTNENPECLIYMFDCIFATNLPNLSVALFDLRRKISTLVASNNISFCNLNSHSLNRVIKKLSSCLTRENAKITSASTENNNSYNCQDFEKCENSRKRN